MHEKLHCYRELLQLAEALAKWTRTWPRGYGYLVDQTRRAMASVILNLAEGNGKSIHTQERKRFFQISMASIAEVEACLDLGKAFALISQKSYASWKEVLRANYYRIRRLP